MKSIWAKRPLSRLFSNIEPYRVFFPLGLLFSLAGVGVWIATTWHWMNGYPRELHADLMIGGFLTSFAAGFLMTAIPRFTGSYPARPFELCVVFILFASFTVACILGIKSLLIICLLGIMGFLLIFGLGRFIRRSFSPPAGFIFVGFGICFAIVGLCLRFTTESFALGQRLFYQGFMLSLVLGIGAQLVRGLLGWGPLPLVQIEPAAHRSIPLWKRLHFWIFILATFFWLTFFMESWAAATTIARVIRALLIAVLAFQHWKIHRRPRESGHMTLALWISCWMIVIGAFVYAFFPSWGIHGLHLQLISGLGLMTILVASRVVLAHGGYPLTMEKTSPFFVFVCITSLASALTRLIAGTSPHFFEWLSLSAILWTAAVILWAWNFLPRLMKRA